MTDIALSLWRSSVTFKAAVSVGLVRKVTRSDWVPERTAGDEGETEGVEDYFEESHRKEDQRNGAASVR